MSDAFIQIRDLRKIYTMGDAEVHALAGVDLDIAPNSFWALMGPSGSGKSTMLHLTGGLDRPTSGHITVDGRALEEMNENALALYRRLTVGFIFQSFNLISSMTALENVAFPMRFARISRKQRRDKAMDLLGRVGLAERAYHRPTELSGGQQQRVAVARALVNDPKLILADEPTGNLDTTSGLSIMHLLSELHHGGRTVVVVTHDPRMAHFATNRAFLLDGHIVSEDEYNAATSAALQMAESSVS
jgi:putative ABC transport system ATP-binding protein